MDLDETLEEENEQIQQINVHNCKRTTNNSEAAKLQLSTISRQHYVQISQKHPTQ